MNRTTKAEEIIDLNMAFWNREEISRPLISIRIGSDCVFDLFEAGAESLRNKQDIQPDDIIPERFLADYERWMTEMEEIDHDVFFTLEPFFGALWANVICGCRLDGGPDSAWARPPEKGIDNWLKGPINLERNPWFEKLIEFNKMLVNFSAGRFPIIQPCMRGPSEILNGLVGDEQAVIGLSTGNMTYQSILEKAADVFVEILHRLHKNQPPFNGGWCLGYYRLWAPEPSCRLQEDGATLYSPQLYEKYLKPLDEKILSNWNYNVIHQHFPHQFLLDHILSLPSIKCVEYDVDWEDRIMELIPSLKKVQQSGKCLIIDGYISWENVKLLTKSLDNRGLLFHIKRHTLLEAKKFVAQFHEYFNDRKNGA